MGRPGQLWILQAYSGDTVGLSEDDLGGFRKLRASLGMLWEDFGKTMGCLGETWKLWEDFGRLWEGSGETLGGCGETLGGFGKTLRLWGDFGRLGGGFGRRLGPRIEKDKHPHRYNVFEGGLVVT